MAFLIYIFTLALLTGLVSFIFNEAVWNSINCKELTKPLELDDNHSSIMGKWILAVGAYQGSLGMIRQMDTHWMELSPGTNNDTFLLRQALRIDNSCTFETNEYPLKHNPLHEPDNSGNIQYYLLPSSSNCLTEYFSLSQENKENFTRALLLFSREHNVSTSSMDLFKKQAECLGFPKMFTFYSTVSGQYE
ncbi:uncharacterized protein Hap1MRO34_012243 isoform 1-T1 [Clarias gariepinus]